MSTVDSRPAKPGRGKEFFLLLLASSIGLCAWILADIGLAGDDAPFALPQSFLTVAPVALLVVFAAHFIVRAVAPWADPILFPSAVALNGLGLAMIHRIDADLIAWGGAAQARGQLILSAGGIVLMLATVIAIRDHRRLRKFTYISLILAIVCLLAPMLPVIGREVYGARLWINVLGFSYQPAELAKIFLAIFFSGYLVSQRDNLALAGPKVLGIQLPQLRHFAPILVAWVACLGILAMENDFGTALLFFGLFVAMLYVATERISWIIIGLLLSAGGIFGIVKLLPRIQARIDIWLHAFDPDIYNADFGSYQLVQGWFGMGAGGLFGTGLGKGFPSNSFAANSDFIIPSLAEELGLAGVLAIMCIFMLLISRAFNAGLHLHDGFGKLLAAGLGFTIAIQCFVVVGGVTRVIPLTGLAMPFLALGGSALLTNWIIIGLLIRMSDGARRPQESPSTPLSMIDTGELNNLFGDDEAPSDADASSDGEAPVPEDAPDLDDGSQPTEVVKL